MSSRWISLGLVAGMALCSSQPAMAQQRERTNLSRPTEGYTYFNRPGATIQQHHADVQTCAALVAGPLNHGITGQPLPTPTVRARDDSRFQVNVENCMVVKGWRVVSLPEGIGRALFRMEPDALSTQLATVVGVDSPETGRIVRTFGNEALRGDTIWGSLPAHSEARLISLRAVSLENLPTLPPRAEVGPPASPPVPPFNLTPDTITRIPQGTAIVITRAVGTGQTNGEGFSFLRIREDGETPFIRTVETDPIHAFMAVLPWTLFKGSARERRETVAAYAVVPGRYRLTAKMNTLEFCHGSPVVEVRAGDVLFAGTFDMAGDATPDMSLDPARAFLANDPERLARLRPAEWRNGSIADCRYVYAYALEFPGAPFVEGYADGSRAGPAAAQ